MSSVASADGVESRSGASGKGGAGVSAGPKAASGAGGGVVCEGPKPAPEGRLLLAERFGLAAPRLAFMHMHGSTEEVTGWRGRGRDGVKVTRAASGRGDMVRS